MLFRSTHPEIWAYPGETMGQTMRAMLDAEKARRLEQLAEDEHFVSSLLEAHEVDLAGNDDLSGLDVGHAPDGQEDPAPGGDLDDDAEDTGCEAGAEQHDDVADPAHLVAQGHRRIAFLGGPQANFEARERERGYRAGLASGMTPWVLDGDFSEAAGARAGAALLALPAQDRPDAVFAAVEKAILLPWRLIPSVPLRETHRLTRAMSAQGAIALGKEIAQNEKRARDYDQQQIGRAHV